MKTFKDIIFKPHPNLMWVGVHGLCFFPNGYGVSVVRGKSLGGYYLSYTNNEKEWEVAILCGTKHNWSLTYETPITDDVLGHLTEKKVSNIMIKVQKLKRKKKMENEIVKSKPNMGNVPMTKAQADVLEKVLLDGDLSKLNPSERIIYYHLVCESVGLNPHTKPFDLLTMNGKMILYPNRTCTDQLRTLHKIVINKIERTRENDMFIATAYASTPDGRGDISSGVIWAGRLSGDALQNAYMKAETKAKRRVTLSIVGLGWIDESEVDSIPGAVKHTIDIESGKVEPIVKILKPSDEQLNALFAYKNNPKAIEVIEAFKKMRNIKNTLDLDLTQYENLMKMLNAFEAETWEFEAGSSHVEDPNKTV